MAFASETRFHLTIALWMVAHAPNQVAKGQRLVRSSGQTAMAPIPSKEVVVGPRGSPENSPQPFQRAAVVTEKHLPEEVREGEASTDPERETVANDLSCRVPSAPTAMFKTTTTTSFDAMSARSVSASRRDHLVSAGHTIETTTRGKKATAT